jgi:hypothetical protein
VSDYGLDDRAIGVRSPVGAKDFSSSLCVQTGSGAHSIGNVSVIFWSVYRPRRRNYLVTVRTTEFIQDQQFSLREHFLIYFFIHFPVVPNWNIGPLSRFLWSHIQLDTRKDSSGRVISPSQRPLPTQDNITYKHNRQTSMPRAGFEPEIPATKWLQTYYALDSAATGILIITGSII